MGFDIPYNLEFIIDNFPSKNCLLLLRDLDLWLHSLTFGELGIFKKFEMGLDSEIQMAYTKLVADHQNEESILQYG